jgi:uncharacterized membrane protein
MFFVAKRKRKRKASPNSSAASRSRRFRAPFVGDQILAMYQMITCCCLNSVVALLAALAVKLDVATKVRADLHKYISNREVLSQINSMTEMQGYILFGAVGILAIFSIIYVVSTWKGRKWALILHLFLNLPGAAATIFFGQADQRFGSILSIVVAIYCMLRLFGSVGPRV